MREDRGVVKKLGVRDFIPIDDEAVRHHWVPVVELAELQGDAVAVLERHIEEQGGIELQLQQVTAQMLHILFYYYLDDLPWVAKNKTITQGHKLSQTF